MNRQFEIEIPRDKKEIRLVIKLDNADLIALESGMRKVGETNKSSYIRRLIHESKGK